MKKIVSVLTAACMLGGFALTSHAQIVTSNEMGISVYVDDSWTANTYDDLMIFRSAGSDDEAIRVSSAPSNDGYDIELFDEADIRNMCNSYYSDGELAANLAEVNNDPSVWVTTDSIVDNFEYHNGVKYYRYEKSYTAHGNLFRDTSFYDTVFVTAQNGNIYFIEYGRNYSEANRFNDVTDLLNSISYEPGAIKINVNGKRITPDSVPIIVEGRTLVPIRAVAEAMGYDVEWNDAEKIAIIYSELTQRGVAFEIGTPIALNEKDEQMPLDVPPIIFAGRTYLPVRAAAESLDAKVNWDGNTRTIDIWQ